MTYLGSERFIVRELEGYAQPSYGGGSAGPGLSITIIDRAYCALVVASWRSEDIPSGGRGYGEKLMTYDRIRAKIRRLALERCTELNARTDVSTP